MAEEKRPKGFQPGNTLASKKGVFDAALRRAIAQDDGARVRDAAEQLLNKAASGEEWAIAYLADRLDGKPVQQVQSQISHEYVARVPDICADSEAWSEKWAPTTPQTH